MQKNNHIETGYDDFDGSNQLQDLKAIIKECIVSFSELQLEEDKKSHNVKNTFENKLDNVFRETLNVLNDLENRIEKLERKVK